MLEPPELRARVALRARELAGELRPVEGEGVMDDERVRRLAENEAIARQVNEQVEKLGTALERTGRAARDPL